MALGSTMKAAAKRIAEALNDFAVRQGWKPNEYQILFHLNPKWGRIRVFFIAKDFGGLTRQELWGRVLEHMERELAKGPDLGYSVGLSVRDWNQVNQGAAYSVPPGYIDYNELLLAPSVTD